MSSTDLAAGTYYFAATAYNTGCIESAYSNEIGTEITAAACSYEIAPVNAEVGASGGAGSVQVTASDGCPWTVYPWERLAPTRSPM